ncbi:MAG: toll/interleukin-1 receptor domain-containing protein [Thermoanaerobaculia bacterium]
MPTQAANSVFDYFISYKQKDTKTFAKQLADALTKLGAEVWLDQEHSYPGESILASIEMGISSSVDAILILSRNYFEGWADEERKTLETLMASKKVRIVPVWYQLERSDIETRAPNLANIIAIHVSSDDEGEVVRVAGEIVQRCDFKQREQRLYELFFRAVRQHKEDPDLDLFLGVFENNIPLLEKAIAAGGNVNVTDTALWNRYNRIVTEHEDVFPAWRKLFLHLAATGRIGGGS